MLCSSYYASSMHRTATPDHRGELGVARLRPAATRLPEKGPLAAPTGVAPWPSAEVREPPRLEAEASDNRRRPF